MRIGVLTGGGDCPGLNAAIRAIAHRAWMLHDEVHGFREGWAGPRSFPSSMRNTFSLTGSATV